MAIYLRGKKIAGGGRNLSTNNPALITYNTGETTEQPIIIQENNVLINSNTKYTYSSSDENTVQSQMYLPIKAGDNVSFTIENGSLVISSTDEGKVYSAGTGINISSSDEISLVPPENITLGYSMDSGTMTEMDDGYWSVGEIRYRYGAEPPFTWLSSSQTTFVLPLKCGTGIIGEIKDGPNNNYLEISAVGNEVTVEKFTRSA